MSGCRRCGLDKGSANVGVLCDPPFGRVHDFADSADDGPSNIVDTCCGKCPGDTCYVDQVTGA